MPTQVPNSRFTSTNATVNLLHMKLFHHFQTETRQTLLCGQEAWDYALQLSFEFDYLMNAMLCIAARHLAVICPEDPTYKTAAASHLCRASSGLRGELSKDSTSIHLDAFLATSILFYYDTWTNTDYFLPPQENQIAPEAWADCVFGFSSSLKKTLLTGFERPWEQPSLFRQSLIKNPGDEIAAISQVSPNRLAEYESFFSYGRPLTMEMLNMSPSSIADEDGINLSSRSSHAFQTQVAAGPAEDAYVPVVRRLCLILPFLEKDHPLDSPSGLDSPPTLPLLAKFILSFPLLGWSAFPALIERGDSHALFLLYHFYRAVRILLSHKHWWWAHKRAVVVEGVLRELPRIEEYEKLNRRKMVTLSDVIASNERIPSALPSGLVAVFVGGTSGVGEYTLKAFARYARAPKAIIIGRSQEAADRILNECRQLKPDGHFEFIRADVSLLKNVDDVCRQIKEKVSVINILFESQGSLAFHSGKLACVQSYFHVSPIVFIYKSPEQLSEGNEQTLIGAFAKCHRSTIIETDDGLPTAFALGIHSRLRFIVNLLPLLQRADSLRRVVSVGAATCEGAIDLNNIPGRGFSLMKWRDQVASVATLMLEEAQRRAPDVAFVHTVPGVVESGIMRDVQPTLRLSIIIGISRLLAPLINVPPTECGERHIFVATSAAFAPGDGMGHAGVPLDGIPPVASRGTNGRTGSGMYSLSQKNDPATPKTEEVLRRLREDGTAQKVWDSIVADFKRITGSEVAT
ncbi:hypothetical protein GQX73_g8356 [Xylaria multiplex]|uniref:Ketoreductase (KR) domain-containing protein n=1 Tax=Xylaria multiplex TaxID=323545 RepID=A0A7C8IJQ9_9PEZI|nr:hypothetical protein GQX73_g8356 [Xylaria multiplex]